MHQFEKVEQFTVCSPHKDASWQALDDMLASAESFYQLLGLPYQVLTALAEPALALHWCEAACWAVID